MIGLMIQVYLSEVQYNQTCLLKTSEINTFIQVPFMCVLFLIFDIKCANPLAITI